MISGAPFGVCLCTGFPVGFAAMFTRIPAKREMFLLHVLDGMPGSHAYATVYGLDLGKATCEANASRLLRDAKVQARRAELIAARAARQPLSLEFLTRELMATAGESRALGQGSAAAACYMGAAKLNGMIIDRVQADVLVRKPSASPESPDDMSPEEWMGAFTKTIEHQEPEQSPEPSGSATSIE